MNEQVRWRMDITTYGKKVTMSCDDGGTQVMAKMLDLLTTHWETLHLSGGIHIAVFPKGGAV